MAALDPAFVGFAHFGPRRDAQAALNSAENRIWEWVELIEQLNHLPDDQAAHLLEDHTLTRYRSDGAPPQELAFYTGASGRWDMHVNGVRRWIDQQSTRNPDG